MADPKQETQQPEQMPKTLRELIARLDAEGITDYRRYYQVRQFMDFKGREKGVPVTGTFEVTPLCNLDCKMCYVHLNADQLHGAKLLPVETWKDFARQAFDAGMMYASITGGECLTYPGFKELYLYLGSLGVETHVLSNSVLIDEETTEFFKANPPAYIQVTLYGASEDAYERVTGRRVFGKVVENIRRIRDAGIPISISVTPNAFMTDGLDVVKFLHEEDFPFIINSGILSPREETGRKLEDAELDVYIDMLKLRRELTGNGIEPECKPDMQPVLGPSQGESPRGVLCGAGRSSFAIDWHGRMRPCNTFPCDPVDVAALGFAESWRLTNKTACEFPLPIECEGCSFQHVCKACVSEHSAGAEVGHASPAICSWGKRMVAEGLIQL